VTFGVEYHEGNWWINYANQWIGYLKGSFWPEGFSYAPVHQVFGEIYDSTEKPKTQMGSGKFGAETGSTEMNGSIDILNPNQQESDQGVANPPGNLTEPKWYSIGKVNAGRTTWHFGGPGG